MALILGVRYIFSFFFAHRLGWRKKDNGGEKWFNIFLSRVIMLPRPLEKGGAEKLKINTFLSLKFGPLNIILAKRLFKV